jgi:hypothetical protein
VLILGILAAVLTLGLAGSFAMKKLGKLRDEKQLAEATSEIRRLEGRRLEVARERGETDKQVQLLDEEIKKQKRLAVSAYEGGAGLSDDELEEAFREALGG